VLEVGLGYGTLGSRLAYEGAEYLGMDIASNPGSMLKQSFEMLQIPGDAVQDDFLNNNLESDGFDFVVSIGCFHHTGSISSCLNETYRILKPGGIAIVMLYNQYSLARWFRWPLTTFRTLFQVPTQATPAQRKAYDASSDGSAAPVTEFSSAKRVQELFSQFSHIRVRKENCDDIRLRRTTLIPRERFLS
jgi:SAM-dependent methyltransferase